MDTDLEEAEDIQEQEAKEMVDEHQHHRDSFDGDNRSGKDMARNRSSKKIDGDYGSQRSEVESVVDDINSLADSGDTSESESDDAPQSSFILYSADEGEETDEDAENGSGAHERGDESLFGSESTFTEEDSVEEVQELPKIQAVGSVEVVEPPRKKKRRDDVIELSSDDGSSEVEFVYTSF